MLNSKSVSQIVTVSNPAPVEVKGDIETFVSGSKTFSYTKIANDGSELPKTAKLGTGAKDWACTKDNNTGLIWEVKTDDGSFRDMKLQNNTWYEPNAKNNGNPGSQDGKSNTSAYATAVNNQGLCRANNWRLPTKDELLSIVKLGLIPAIDTIYFPDTIDGNRRFWSSSLYMSGGGSAWYVDFENGTSGQNGKSGRHFNVRLVSGVSNITMNATLQNLPNEREKCLEFVKAMNSIPGGISYHAAMCPSR